LRAREIHDLFDDALDADRRIGNGRGRLACQLAGAHQVFGAEDDGAQRIADVVAEDADEEIRGRLGLPGVPAYGLRDRLVDRFVEAGQVGQVRRGGAAARLSPRSSARSRAGPGTP
jgi:hypothetical protein